MLKIRGTGPAGRSQMYLYTAVAMLAFAANSVICRMALLENTIDPASFTTIRLFSGALLLLAISFLTQHDRPRLNDGNWISGLLLFVYAICFAYAYVALSSGVGALILFGFVQATMIFAGLWAGDRPQLVELVGWALASTGMIWLLLPGEAAPQPLHSAIMAMAGIAWGFYSVRGRRARSAIATTSMNFLFSCVFVAVLFIVTFSSAQYSAQGVVLAITSGAITSALGYVVWYAALNHLTTLQAALVQLSVPTIVAGGGVVFLAEFVSMRLLVSSILVLGGIGFALSRKMHKIDKT